MSPILDLPPELMILTLQNLPARRIQLTRQVSRHFRDIVDANVQTITEPIYSREYKRLDHHIQYTFGYDIDETSPVEALRRWFLHRPLVQYGRLGDDEDAHIPYLTKVLQSKLPLDASAPGLAHWQHEREVSGEVRVLKMCLIERHHRYQVLSMAGCNVVGSSSELAATMVDDSVAQAMNWTQATIEGFFAEMEDPARPILPTEIHGPQAIAQQLFAIFPITRLNTEALRNPYAREDRRLSAQDAHKLYSHCSGMCERARLTEAVGAPLLPVTSLTSMSRAYAAYCVRSSWARDLVKRSLAGKAGMLMKVAVMEELFIY